MKNIYRILGALLIVPFLTSCFEDPGTDVTIDGSVLQVELTAATANSASFTYLRENNGAQPNAGFGVNLLGATSPGVDVTFEIDAASTAVEGVQYNLGGTSVTIPAGEYSAVLPITINPDNIEAGEQWTIIVNITGAGSADVSPNYATATHTVQISCPPNIGVGTYTTAVAGIPDPDGCATGFAYAGASVEVTYDAGAGLYTISDADIGYFSGDYTAPTDFVNVCDVLTLQGNPGAPYGISFVGSGIFVPGGGANGTGQIVFQCYYDNTYAGPGATETVAYDAAADVVF